MTEMQLTVMEKRFGGSGVAERAAHQLHSLPILPGRGFLPASYAFASMPVGDHSRDQIWRFLCMLPCGRK